MNEYDELSAYAQSLRDDQYIHQHVVDAHIAQEAGDATKPIGLVMSLTGLYLHVEHGWSGREVRRAHMHLAREKKTWPAFTLPKERGAIGPGDVLAGHDREAVWNAYAPANRATVEQVLREGGIDPESKGMA